MGNKVKTTYLYFFVFALTMLCIDFFYVEKQIINQYSFSLPKFFIGVTASLFEGNELTVEISNLSPLTKSDVESSNTISDNFKPNLNQTILLNDDRKQDNLKFLIDVDCQTVEPYNPLKLFGIAYENGAVVNLKQQAIPESPIKKIGFVKAVLVFGIYIISSELVSEHELEHAAKIFAKYIDNDEDGKADNPEVLQHLQNFNLVIGYLHNYDDSENFWLSKFLDSEYMDFREIFFCHIHFFEEWLIYSKKYFYVDSFSDENKAAQGEHFDWNLWYMLLPICYYGYVEHFNLEQKNIVNAALKKAKDEEIFKQNYESDKEMELSNFFSWSILTKLNALQFYCNEENVAIVWKLCEPDSLIILGEEFFFFLDELPHIPKVIPNGEYNIPSFV